MGLLLAGLSLKSVTVDVARLDFAFLPSRVVDYWKMAKALEAKDFALK